MAKTGQALVNQAMKQVGKRYIFGYETKLSDPSPPAFDCCLSGDTIVHTERGPVPITEVEPGDRVWSWDEGACVTNKVRAVAEQPTQKLHILRLEDRQVRATANHPFMRRTEDGVEWSRLDGLDVGDSLVVLDDDSFGFRGVISITEDVDEPTYDLEIEGAHNFVADGVLVHNSELVEHSLYQIGVKFVDGSWNQIAKCTKISVAQGLRTPGALLYKPGHIVISRGDNTTIEAKGRNYGVGVFSALNRFNQAGLVPALIYGNPTSPPVDLLAIAKAIAAAKRTVLRRGSKGDAVKWAQVGINNLSGRGLKVDGDFGPATEKAVVDLQRWFRLSVDGVIGPQTWRIIYP